ncbi:MULTISPECIES: DUF6274 family protein [unclassified Streptomyces]|uniref:DUF6274 family protein n=1 Tax=unclassified Streptomyces TaxID=2593676 RepID=UPI00093E4BB0|nr:DUF6274 family protein [Streptomyces sp. TSRI0281]OKI42122.1 hypothetical protein A6A29_36860 [Streptomyces sp. TSRI0281]
MSASTARHETRALLRAHLAAASDFRHLTRHCPVCHRLLRLAMEPLTAPEAPYAPPETPEAPQEASDAPEAHEAPERGERPAGAREGTEDESPAPA